jgi:uncharacterized membrane protein YbhN (UPF0104 family)
VAGISILCFVRAFQLTVPWQAGFLVLSVTNLGGAIPSSPGAIGVYEFLAMLALSAWLTEHSAALGFAVVTHVANLAMTVLFGLLAAWRVGVRFSELSTEGSTAKARLPATTQNLEVHEDWQADDREPGV